MSFVHTCLHTGHSFVELKSSNGRIFCTLCGEFRGDEKEKVPWWPLSIMIIVAVVAKLTLSASAS
jgi:hypothetical protein